MVKWMGMNLKSVRRRLQMQPFDSSSVKAVLFDLDGTILDTEKFYRKNWPIALAHFGYEMTDEQALKIRSMGRPFVVTQFKEWFGEDCDYWQIRRYRSELVKEDMEREGIKPKKGAREILEYLREKGILCAVATATDVPRASAYLEQVGLLELFDRVCSACDAPQGKPDPYVYLEACRQLGVYAEETLAVEDAPNGIRSAHWAGCRVIFVPDQTAEEPEMAPYLTAQVEDLLGIKALFGD